MIITLLVFICVGFSLCGFSIYGFSLCGISCYGFCGFGGKGSNKMEAPLNKALAIFPSFQVRGYKKTTFPFAGSPSRRNVVYVISDCHSTACLSSCFMQGCHFITFIKRNISVGLATSQSSVGIMGSGLKSQKNSTI